ncbi:MAG: formyltransferase [Sulfuricaulis sp.]|uniref:formyltransferase n=1 Tax=Sulfuricaulis sp. TaxID=2003553 RepID=UPI003C3B28B9
MTEPGIVVFGYHDVGVECLDALISRGSRVLAVFTHLDNPEEKIWFRSVAQLARRHGIPVHTPDSVNSPEWIAQLREMKPDIIFSFYYRNMICQEILDIPRLGAFNLHGSLLPKYRGRVPINWAVLNGEIGTGATLHHMVKRPDAGDIVDQEVVPIGPRDTAQDVFIKVTAAARRVLERSLDAIKQGHAPRRPQDESQATYFGGRKPDDGHIDWHAENRQIFNLIRALTHPYPGAFTDVDGRRFFIWWAEPRPDGVGRPGQVVSIAPLRVAAGNGSLEITKWQWRGGPEQEGGMHGLRLDQVLGEATSQTASV